MPAVIQVKRGTASSWTSANTVLAAGEVGFETDTKKMKVGDGSTAWTSLGYTATDGDISGVTAGTGLSGGGTSGAVTITNSMATEITAKGDLIAGTGSATFDNLPVGTNGQTLVADSSTATGLKWATPTSSSLPTFSAYKSASTQTFASGTFTKVTFDVESWDTANNFASSTFTPTTAGYYSVNTGLYHSQVSNGDFQFVIYKNGSRWQRLTIVATVGGVAELHGGQSLVYCNGSTDYIEIYARGDTGGTVSIVEGAELTYFSAIGIRA